MASFLGAAKGRLTAGALSSLGSDSSNSYGSRRNGMEIRFLVFRTSFKNAVINGCHTMQEGFRKN